jgi:Protein of unknown function (DUF2721)
MPARTVAELIPVLQVAIGPVILISGVGLLLLTMTNRLGRVVDRSRSLHREMRALPPEERARPAAQLAILIRRGRLVRTAIFLASVSVLLAALLVIALFVTALLGLQIAGTISALFVLCMAALIGSLVVFIYDINQSLAALKLEIGEADASR